MILKMPAKKFFELVSFTLHSFLLIKFENHGGNPRQSELQAGQRASLEAAVAAPSPRSLSGLTCMITPNTA
jgi:hypothetical protein